MLCEQESIVMDVRFMLQLHIHVGYITFVQEVSAITSYCGNSYSASKEVPAFGMDHDEGNPQISTSIRCVMTLIHFIILRTTD